MCELSSSITSFVISEITNLSYRSYTSCSVLVGIGCDLICYASYSFDINFTVDY